ncbi:hypothetical protein ACFGVR_14150 [Mucilaginibacter sp. AW1-3]
MKKSTLVVVLVLSALLLQYCKKDSESATTTNTTIYPFSAYINDTLWIPTAYTTQVAYTAATKSKVFTCTGTLGTQQVNLAVTQQNASSVGNGFPTGTFNVDASGKVVLSYAKAASGSSVFVPQGTVKSGFVTVSAVDSVKMTITGTFGFNTVSYTYDTGGNITSLTVNNVTSGTFNSLPYTYKKQ